MARGGSYHELGEHEKGLADRTTAIGLDPGSPLGWTARGNAYYLLGRYDEALADLLHAQKLDPNNADTRELAAKAQAMVDELVSRARAKEAAPETATVVLPGAPEPAPKPEPQPAAGRPPPRPSRLRRRRLKPAKLPLPAPRSIMPAAASSFRKIGTRRPSNNSPRRSSWILRSR